MDPSKLKCACYCYAYLCDGQLRPVIDSVFPYDRLPEAYAKMKAGHNRGKIVVQMEL